jgi:beta-N-acetylhexosaminidase
MNRRILAVVLLLSTCAFAGDKFQRVRSVHLDSSGRKWAQKTLRKLSLEQKVGQLFMIQVRAQFMNVGSPEYLQLRDTLRRYHIGAILVTVPYDSPFVYRQPPYEIAELINALQRDSDLPLLVASDFERGPSMRLTNASPFPAAMAFGAAGKLPYVTDFARISAQEARALGVQWNLFPVADVNSNPDNPIINTRSFGEDPAQVSQYVAEYIRAARQAGLLTTAKHFPGHGDTDMDSHLGLPTIPGDRRRIESVELPPFRAAIAAGVDSIMLEHELVPALDPDSHRPASISPVIIGGTLRGELGFQGLVIPDAMDMNALNQLFVSGTFGPGADPAVEAVKAGEDMVVMPFDLDASYRALVAAVRSGQIPEAQIDASVTRILEAKASVGLEHARLVDVSALPTQIATPQNVAKAQAVADAAVTLLRDNGRVLPLVRQGTAGSGLAYGQVVEAGTRVLVIIFSDDLRLDSGHRLEREIRARVPGADIQYVDLRTATPLTPALLEKAARAQKVVVALFIAPTWAKQIRVGGELKNSVSLGDASAALLHALLEAAADKTAVVSLGSPYVIAGFPAIQTYLCTYSSVASSEVSAVKALFGEMPIQGSLPVTIPHIAERGAGIHRPALSARKMARRFAAP